MILSEFEALKNLANGPIIFTYYAKSDLSISAIQYSDDKLNRAIGEYYNGTKNVIDVT